MIQISCGSKTVKYHLAINCFHFVFLFSDKFDHKQGDPPTKPTSSPAAEKFEVDAVFTQLVEQLGIGVQPLFLCSSIDTLKRGNFLDTCKCFSMELSRYLSSLALLDEFPNKRDNSKRPLQKEIAAMNIEVEELAQKLHLAISSMNAHVAKVSETTSREETFMTVLESATTFLSRAKELEDLIPLMASLATALQYGQTKKTPGKSKAKNISLVQKIMRRVYMLRSKQKNKVEVSETAKKIFCVCPTKSWRTALDDIMNYRDSQDCDDHLADAIEVSPFTISLSLYYDCYYCQYVAFKFLLWLSYVFYLVNLFCRSLTIWSSC